MLCPKSLHYSPVSILCYRYLLTRLYYIFCQTRYGHDRHHHHYDYLLHVANITIKFFHKYKASTCLVVCTLPQTASGCGSRILVGISQLRWITSGHRLPFCVDQLCNSSFRVGLPICLAFAESQLPLPSVWLLIQRYNTRYHLCKLFAPLSQNIFEMLKWRFLASVGVKCFCFKHLCFH